MKRLILITALCSLFIMCKSKEEKKETEPEITKIEEVIKKVTEAEIIFSSQDVRPGNLALTANGRLFVSMNPLMSPTTKVFELNTDGKNSAIAYPNEKLSTGDNSILKGVIGIRADSKGNLYLLDMLAKQFIVWNTKTEKLVKRMPLAKDVVVPTSFLQDFIIDEKHNRLIIADMTQGDLKSAPIPAFIVVDIETGASKRMAKSHPSMMPEIEGGFALNPIAIDPNFEYVYFGALNGRTIYRVPAANFNDNTSLTNNIEKFGTKSFCDGMAVDDNENVYVTNVEKTEISVFNKKDGFRTLATLPKGQSWPDGLYVANDGYVYGTVDQLNRTAALNKGDDISTGPYLVIRTPLLK
ncbi:L-dopachrome tautomerase-related protein [uncultured Aquimarina sp.]|uniref:L-dopachrome tautomerase-related protein n=1 Tax=uncultured Aquimarina sp. TaxID=575652 RepID=UPI002603DA86|nr:L-dopachrome tautomerase-related protein [uncultured Aquimarina sp.]